MDSYFYNEQTNRATKRDDPLQDVPAPAFNHINDLLNFCSNMDTLVSWMETVLHHRNLAVETAEFNAVSSTSPKRSYSRKPSMFPLTEAVKPHYTCHKCNETCGSAKEFRRHMDEKCELVRLWHCPNCSKTYHRAYHLRYHHNKHHGCDDHEHCIHLDDSVQYLPAKVDLGCGYCLEWFDTQKSFITHLINHFEQDLTEPQWNDTLSIYSLLQHPRYRTTWEDLCATRFGSASCNMPSLAWDMANIGQELHSLQYGVSGLEMQYCLARLLEQGIGLKRQPSNADSASTSSFGPVLARANAWNELDCNMSDTDRFVDDSPSTLVNTENMWADYTTLPASPCELDQSQWASTDTICDLFSFDKDIDLRNDFMNLTAFDDFENSATVNANAEAYDSIYPTGGMLSTMTHDVEDTVMNSIPAEHPTINIFDTSYFSPNAVATAEDGLVSCNSDLSLDIGMDGIDQLPPFNPTPPLPSNKSHRRSFSGRLMRMLQCGKAVDEARFS